MPIELDLGLVRRALEAAAPLIAALGRREGEAEVMA